MDALIKALQRDFPQFTFVPGRYARWSPSQQQITYKQSADQETAWSLLHELGHALLAHTSYESDLQLLQKEAAAWREAINLGRIYQVAIGADHIQNCLDTYRDWLHKRSACPECGDHGLQPVQGLYCCVNCQSTWKVSSARFCRPYRLKSGLRA